MPKTVFPQRVDSGCSAFAITPNDSTDLSQPIRGLYVGATGNVVVIFEGDTANVTLTGVAGGIVHPFAIKRVLATGTTATGLVGVL